MFDYVLLLTFVGANVYTIMECMVFKEERQTAIVELVDKQGRVSVNDLSKRFSVSQMTIRRDLRELEQHGLLKTSYGGAYPSANLPLENINKIYTRMKIRTQEKQRIAQAIAQMVGIGEMIFLGSGTTTTFVAKALSLRSDITVVTNALTVMEELATNANMTVIAIGGFLRRNEYSFYGHFSETILKDLIVDKVIIGMRGIDPKYGLTSDFPMEMNTDRMIINTGRSVIVAGDHSKIGYVATSVVAPLNVADMVITDSKADPKITAQIEEQGVKVKIV
ncbi:MAG: DeoR/GlpR family DNA-binding transcription regulator [Anaerolineaceae bacterium]|jgi:DeoR/GlpR family transcriptional regulator of sugar metabolism